jgi:uncharacterized protein YifE (UPF0438 family)
MLPATHSFSTSRLDRLQAEIRYAWNAAPYDATSAWAAALPATFSKVLYRRGHSLVSLARVVGKESWRIGHALVRASARGELHGQAKLEYYDIKDSVARKSRASVDALRDVYNRLIVDPKGTAPELVCLVVASLLVSGGLDGDGGAPDLDLALGIGAHRSILTHSILMGATLETCLIAVVTLAKEVHGYLPAEHDALWDILATSADRLALAVNRGIGVGLAYHLAVDGIVQPGTYKDLAVPLPLEGHQAVATINAAAELVDVHHKEESSGGATLAGELTKHRYYLKQTFTVPERLKGRLCAEHKRTLAREGAWLLALATGKILPVTSAQTEFVEAAWGRKLPVTDAEWAWCAYVRLLGRGRPGATTATRSGQEKAAGAFVG